MPTYDYRCKKCGHRFELFLSIKDETRKRCPKCKGSAERMISAGAGILFKGSGFYITDYRSSSYREKAKQEKGSSPGGESAGGSGEKKSGEKKSGEKKKGGGGGGRASGSGAPGG